MHHSSLVPGTVVKQVRNSPILLPSESRQLSRLVCSVGLTGTGTVVVESVP